jgi:hypothetical protein
MRTSAALLLLALAAGCSSPPRDKDFQFTPEERELLQPLPETTPEAVRKMVEHGDDLFAQATPAYRRADPQSGPNWETRHAMALDLYTRARESYIAAQAESGLIVPPPILKRSRECLNRMVALQRMKRAAQK